VLRRSISRSDTPVGPRESFFVDLQECSEFLCEAFLEKGHDSLCRALLEKRYGTLCRSLF